ncbi:MAG: hypothetical protein ACE14S_12090, partial [Candidatus Bathyarchaeia archaeon]
MKKAKSHRGESGQVLIITSLIVVMLLLSSVIYITETQKDMPEHAEKADVNPAAMWQAARHTVTSALANVSGGGDPS